MQNYTNHFPKPPIARPPIARTYTFNYQVLFLSAFRHENYYSLDTVLHLLLEKTLSCMAKKVYTISSPQFKAKIRENTSCNLMYLY